MKSNYTGKFKIGDLVKIIKNENWPNPNGTVVQIRPDKKSHNYQVKLSEEVHDSYWFSQDEIELLAGEMV